MMDFSFWGYAAEREEEYEREQNLNKVLEIAQHAEHPFHSIDAAAASLGMLLSYDEYKYIRNNLRSF